MWVFLLLICGDDNLFMNGTYKAGYRQSYDDLFFIDNSIDSFYMDINCVHFGKCSGCFRNQNVDLPDIFFDVRQFFAEKGFPNVQLHTGQPTGWRCRAKLAVQGTFSAPLIGLFEEKTHQVITIPHCKVHHPAINKAVEIVKKWISDYQIHPYNEVSKTGLLRYLQFTVDRSTSKVQVVLVLNLVNINALSSLEKIALDHLWDLFGFLGHSIWINFNQRQDNVIFNENWYHYIGEELLWGQLLGRQICFHPASFMQANLEMFERLLMVLKRWLKADSSSDKILELYAGVGAIGLSLVDECHHIRCVEIVPSATSCFEESWKKLPSNLQQQISFICGSAEKQRILLTSFAEVVIVDPPRKGLDPSLLKDLCQLPQLKRIAYISCGWKSFKRDCEEFLSRGKKLNSVEAFLFFPGSEHVEILALFE